MCPSLYLSFLITVLIICERSVMLYRYEIYMIYIYIGESKVEKKKEWNCYFLRIIFIFILYRREEKKKRNTRYFYKFVESDNGLLWILKYRRIWNTDKRLSFILFDVLHYFTRKYVIEIMFLLLQFLCNVWNSVSQLSPRREFP